MVTNRCIYYRHTPGETQARPPSRSPGQVPPRDPGPHPPLEGPQGAGAEAETAPLGLVAHARAPELSRHVGRADAEATSGGAPAAAMDPFLVLLHSVSAGLSSNEVTELKFLCQGRVGKRKMERVQSGLDLFSVLLEQNELGPECTVLLRDLLASLRRQDLLRRLDDFEAGAAHGAAPQERGGRGRGGQRRFVPLSPPGAASLPGVLCVGLHHARRDTGPAHAQVREPGLARVAWVAKHGPAAATPGFPSVTPLLQLNEKFLGRKGRCRPPWVGKAGQELGKRCCCAPFPSACGRRANALRLNENNTNNNSHAHWQCAGH